jgi:hypothetical protein
MVSVRCHVVGQRVRGALSQLDSHCRGEGVAEGVDGGAEAHEKRTPEGLVLHHHEAAAGGDPALA